MSSNKQPATRTDVNIVNFRFDDLLKTEKVNNITVAKTESKNKINKNNSNNPDKELKLNVISGAPIIAILPSSVSIDKIFQYKVKDMIPTQTSDITS